MACSNNSHLLWNARASAYDEGSGYLVVAPTDVPTEAPTNAPTEVSTDAPTEASTDVPTEASGVNDGAALCGLVHSTNMHSVSKDWTCTRDVPNTPYCGDMDHKKWSGVTCDANGRVTEINWGFTDFYVHGNIDSSIRHLTEVTSLDFHHQLLKGPIEPELGNLPNLQYLDLSVNMFTGGLPGSFRGLKQRGVEFKLYGNELDR